MARYTRIAAPLCVAAIVLLGMVAVSPAGRTDGGCVPGDTTGQVPRNARAGDNLCVAPAIAAVVAKENANPTANRDPNGGTTQNCASGFVWREAFVGDTACVTVMRRSDSWAENKAAGIGPTGGLGPTSIPTTTGKPAIPPVKPPADPGFNEPPFEPVCQKWRGANSDELILAEDNGYHVFLYTSLTGQASFEGHGGPQVTGDITGHDAPDGTDDRNIGFRVHWSNGWVSRYSGEIDADGTARGTYRDDGPKGEVHSGSWNAVDKFVCAD